MADKRCETNFRRIAVRPYAHRIVRSAAVVLAILCISATWSAASPLPANTSVPKTGFVSVNGIKLHYLDWGGSGEIILFLSGFNDTAHVYDHFAPRFADHFHVIGLTRRGVGESDKPADGYDASTRVEDIRHFLQTLGIRKVCLIGHSMAGDELTLFATRYPDRVAKLVYLDAAYDRTHEGYLAGLTDPTNKPDMMQRMRMEALGMSEAADIPVAKMPAKEWAILVATHKAVFAFRPDYTKVQAPALAFYAVTANQHYPSHWLPDGADASVRAKAEAWWKEKGHALMCEPVEQFRREIPHGEIVELRDAKHYIFTGDTVDEVAAKIREFLLKY
jgi:pimeloyl-ACP methyl ester carboxylesterase